MHSPTAIMRNRRAGLMELAGDSTAEGHSPGPGVERAPVELEETHALAPPLVTAEKLHKVKRRLRSAWR